MEMNNKMNGIKVDNKRRVIEITKKFQKAASYFGTEEYNALQQVKRDYPQFRVAVKKPAKRTVDTCKGLTYKYMELYIKNNDDEKGSVMSQYQSIRQSDNVLTGKPYTYAQIKKWFLNTYPDMKAFSDNRTKVLDDEAFNNSREKKEIAA